METADIVPMVISTLALIVSMILLYEVRRTTQLQLLYQSIFQLESELAEQPDFLRFYGVGEDAIKRCGLTVAEFVYIYRMFTIFQSFYVSNYLMPILLSERRFMKSFMLRAEVREAWLQIVKPNKLFDESSFTRDIEQLMSSHQTKSEKP